MLDLLGFWTAVTLLSGPAIFVSVVISVLVLDGLGGWITRGRCHALGQKLPGLKQFCKMVDGMPEPLFYMTVIVGLVSGILAPIFCIENSITAVHLVAVLAEALAPFFSWVGIIALVALGARVASDAYYKIAAKLEKLENK